MQLKQLGLTLVFAPSLDLYPVVKVPADLQEVASLLK
jgi:hypothetical protein